jgi:multiple sugar transport system permease protein
MSTSAQAQAAQRVAASRYARQVRLFPWLLMAPTILYLLLLTVFPLLYSLWISLFEVVLGRPSGFIGLGNYAAILSDPAFWQAALTTGVITLVAVGVELALGLVFALVLNKRLPGMGVFQLIIYLPMMVSPLVMGYFWRFMLDGSFGVINWALGLFGLGPYYWLNEPRLALASIIMVDVWQWTPFVVLLVLAGLHTVPPQLYEAATLDRASPWMQFRRITLPYLKTPILLALLFRTIDTIKIFDSIYIMTGGGPGDYTQSLSVLAFREGYNYSHTGKAAALSWLMVIVINILATILIRVLTDRRRMVRI